MSRKLGNWGCHSRAAGAVTGGNGAAGDVTYAVDPRLREAFDYEYLSPTLPAPRGFAWKAKTSVWNLAPQEGAGH